MLLLHGRDDGDHEVLAVLKVVGDLVTKFALRHLHIVLRRAVVRHQVQVAVVDVDELVLTAGHVRHIHVVRRGRNVFVLTTREDVRSDKVDLGVTVLASLRGRHVDNLARAALDHDVTVLTQGRALLGVGHRSTGVGGLEVDVLSLVVRLHVSHHSLMLPGTYHVVVVQKRGAKRFFHPPGTEEENSAVQKPILVT